MLPQVLNGRKHFMPIFMIKKNQIISGLILIMKTKMIDNSIFIIDIVINSCDYCQLKYNRLSLTATE